MIREIRGQQGQSLRPAMPIAWRPGKEFLAQDTLRLQPLIQDCVARPRNSRKNDRHFTGRIRTSLDKGSGELFASIGGTDAARRAPALYFNKVPEPR
jgi:hypothetical protein